MMIDELYDAAKARGLVRSHREFSREFLGRAGNYLADRGFGGCSAGALLNLYKRLGAAGQTDLQALAFTRLLDAERRERGCQEVRP